MTLFVAGIVMGWLGRCVLFWFDRKHFVFVPRDKWNECMRAFDLPENEP